MFIVAYNANKMRRVFCGGGHEAPCVLILKQQKVPPIGEG